MRPRLLPLLLAALPLVACKEPPSFRLRWELKDRAGEELAVTRAIDCTENGVNVVRVRAIDGLGDVAAEELYPCFVPRFEDTDATVDGPTLDPGPYAIEVRGVQRNGEPWVAAEAPPGVLDRRCDPNESGNELGCRARDIACDCDVIDVRQDVTQKLDVFRLEAPAECIDGIDNDQDGLVDAQDAACAFDPEGTEGIGVSVVQFSADVSVFGRTEVSCNDAGLTNVRARACPYVPTEGGVAEPCTRDDGGLATGTIEVGTVACADSEPLFFDARLGMGEYTVELVGLAGTTPLTHPELVAPIEVEFDSPGSFVALDIDFAVEDFLEPVVKPTDIGIEFQRGPELAATRDCAPLSGEGQLVIAEVVLEARDAHGGPLAAPIEVSSPDSSRLDGVASPCPKQLVNTVAIPWGGYTLRVEARAADGTVCFTTDAIGSDPGGPLILAPLESHLVVPRVVDESGTPPPSCRDCSSTADCDSRPCTNGICQP